MLRTGALVGGRYRIVREIGYGGTAIVYLARHVHTGQLRVLKTADREQAPACMTEFHILNGLKHPNLPAIEAYMDDGIHAITVMEYIRGKNLRLLTMESLAKTGKALPTADIWSWVRQLCRVLTYLHTRPEPVVHGDVKPSNILLRPNGKIVLIDFGAAQVLGETWWKARMPVGTPGFAAPEQYEDGLKTGPWTDIYGLGATIYYLMTGRDPGREAGCFPLFKVYPDSVQRGLSVAECRKQLLEQAAARCICDSPTERYNSCEEIWEELRLNDRKQHGKSWMRLVKGTLVMIIALLAGLAAAVKPAQYCSCLEKAAHAQPEECMVLCSRAAALIPGRAAAYLLFLEAAGSDGCFSSDEESALAHMLYSREQGRNRDNLSYLKTHTVDYLAFSYEMGITCYFFAGFHGKKELAAEWFQNVVTSDAGACVMGESWQLRASILIWIGSDDSVASQAADGMALGDPERQWRDLCRLTEDNTEGLDRTIELRIYNEIAVHLMNNAVNYHKMPGIGKKALQELLETMMSRVRQLDPRGGPLRREIEAAICRAKKNVDATNRQD